MEDYWWEVEEMSMDDLFMISSSPPPPSPNNHQPQPQPQIHPPPPMPQPQPLPHPPNMGDMIDEDYMNTINTNETNPITANNPITVEEDNRQSNNEANEPPKNRPGRPLGSQNKIKPPILMNNENVNAMQSAILDIIHDNDVVECLKAYANQYQCGLTVMSGTGFVRDVSLRQLGAADGVIIKLSGKHEILAIHGGFFPGASGDMESGVRVYFADGHGHVIAGVVVGQLVASGLVRVVAAYFTTTILESLPLPFLVPSPPQNLPQFHMQIETSSPAPAPPPQPREPPAGESLMAETSSAPPFNHGYRGAAYPFPPSSF